jgi:hypothetical protein
MKTHAVLILCVCEVSEKCSNFMDLFLLPVTNHGSREHVMKGRWVVIGDADL